MSYSMWKQWVRSLPWCLRWFVLLVLARPVLDVFYYLKAISPFLSPLYIIGVLTPVLVGLSFLSKSFPKKDKSSLDLIFGLWGALIVYNAIAVLSWYITLNTLEIVIKLTLPVVIYFFLRHLIRSKRDLVGILTTFLYSMIFPFAMLLTERFVTPLRTTMKTRGFVRYEGLYADVNSYAYYILLAFLVACYFYLNHKGAFSFKKRASILLVVGSMTVLGLLSMHHAASWGVFGAMIVLLGIHSLGRKYVPALVLLVLIGGIGYYFLADSIGERVAVMFQTDLEVMRGERDEGQAFHGRMSRWKRHVARWDDISPFGQLFGESLESASTGGRLLNGIHNDYLRITFSSGVVGLFLYLSFLVGLLLKSLKTTRSEAFLIRGAIAVLLLYSITSTPSLGAPMLYICLSVFAYGALPQKRGHRVPLSQAKRLRPRIGPAAFPQQVKPVGQR